MPKKFQSDAKPKTRLKLQQEPMATTTITEATTKKVVSTR